MKNRIISICFGYMYYTDRIHFIYEEELLESRDMLSWGPINPNELRRFRQRELFTWEE